MSGVFRVAVIRLGSLRDRRRIGFLAWGARGERKVHSRVFEISPFRPNKILSHRLACITTAVKRLNRYFCFLLLGFHLPVREKWAKMYKSVSQHNYLSIFLKILSFFR